MLHAVAVASALVGWQDASRLPVATRRLPNPVASATYDPSRAVNIVKELATRTAGLTVGPGGADAAKGKILDLRTPATPQNPIRYRRMSH